MKNLHLVIQSLCIQLDFFYQPPYFDSILKIRPLNHLSIATWNVRGLQSPEKQLMIDEILNHQNMNFISILNKNFPLY
jgi:hypothetical protein